MPRLLHHRMDGVRASLLDSARYPIMLTQMLDSHVDAAADAEGPRHEDRASNCLCLARELDEDHDRTIVDRAREEHVSRLTGGNSRRDTRLHKAPSFVHE